ncbi:MAG: hypothetical protein JNL40_00280 [Cyclobacteriaceae bacterium]|nr:hypothetical protein [Cyclobacteriaceae bacterium]
MKPHYPVICILTLLSSCDNSKKVNDKPYQFKESDLSAIEPTDDSVRIVAKKIIKGESIWGSNEDYLFSIFDSLRSSNPETRLICFLAFAEICEQADGYVGEAIGGYVLKYFEYDPIEFMRNSKRISDSTFQDMGYSAGWEIFMSNDSNPDSALDIFISTARRNTHELDTTDQKRLKSFFSRMKEGLDSNSEN